MKKTCIYGEIERGTLYVGIREIYGEWILTTNGDPTTLYELEKAENECAYADISRIHEIINDPSTPWEECNEEDEKYVAEWLRIWGLGGYIG